MGRKSSFIKSNKPTIKKNTLPKKTSHSSTSSGLLGSIAQGVAIGAGASLGSAAINGMLGDNSLNSNQSLNDNTNNTNNNISCEKIVSSFKSCLQHENYNTCNLYLKQFEECFNSKDNH